MAATYSKPTDIPRWADTSSNVVEPSEAKKDEGWVYEEIPPSSYENWRTREIGRWFKWLNERLFDGSTEDAFVIKEPGGGLEMLRLEDPASDSPTAYFPQGFIELVRTGGGKSVGSRLRFLNADRDTEDDAQWFVRTSGDPDHQLQFYFADDSGAVSEYVMSLLAHSSALSIAEPILAFTEDMTVIPLGGGESYFGRDSYRWKWVYVDNFFQTNKAYMFAADILATPIDITTGAVITPTTVRQSALMAATATPSRRFTFSRNGFYRVHFSATWESGAANTTCTFGIYQNGTLILGTNILDHADGSGDQYTSHTHAIIQIINAAADYIEFYGIGNATVGGTIGTVEIIKENMTT